MNLREYLNGLPRGGIKELAQAMGIPPSYLCRLASGNRGITAEWAIKIERATGGGITAHELLPELFPLPRHHAAHSESQPR